MYKIIIVSFVLSIFSFAVSLDNQIDECDKPGDKPQVLYNQEVSKEGEFFKTQIQTLRIPKIGFAPNDITCITVLPMGVDEAYASIKSGGLGAKYVIIYLKSKVGSGFDFHVSVYYNDKKPNSTYSEELVLYA